MRKVEMIVWERFGVNSTVEDKTGNQDTDLVSIG